MTEHRYEKIYGWFNFQDIYRDVVAEASDGDHFVEVGAWLGKSASFMGVEILNSGKNIKFDVVDTWKGSSQVQLKYADEHDVYAEFLKNVEGLPVHPVRLPSVEAAKLYKDWSLYFVFIDASHDYDNVKADINAWLPKIKKGGIIAGHDYSDNRGGVKQAVQECFDNYEVIKSSWRVRL